MKVPLLVLTVLVSGFVFGGCASGDAPLTEADLRLVEHSVDSATRSFLEAERARDAESVLSHIAPSFYMYQDGVRTEYPTVVEQIRTTLPGLQLFATTWEPIEVTPLGPDHALVSFRFRDSIIMGDGALVQSEGPTTLLWERQGSDWLIIYGDADHYPISSP